LEFSFHCDPSSKNSYTRNRRCFKTCARARSHTPAFMVRCTPFKVPPRAVFLALLAWGRGVEGEERTGDAESGGVQPRSRALWDLSRLLAPRAAYNVAHSRLSARAATRPTVDLPRRRMSCVLQARCCWCTCGQLPCSGSRIPRFTLHTPRAARTRTRNTRSA
jgi:hypothetical protein